MSSCRPLKEVTIIVTFNLSSAIALNLVQSKILLFGKELTLFQTTKLKEFEDGNLKLDDKGRNFSRWVENTVGKREIARYEQFLLYSQLFSKDFYCRHVKTRACLSKG